MDGIQGRGKITSKSIHHFKTGLWVNPGDRDVAWTVPQQWTFYI